LPCKEGGCCVLKLPFPLQKNVVSPIFVRHPLPFPDLPICRFHDLPIRFGSAEVSPLVCPPTEVGGYENEASLKQAEKPKGASPDAPKNFSPAQKRCPSENFCFTIRQSPFATRRRFAIRCRFPTCRFADFTICR
jgi:hypothetical protein